MDIGGEGSDDTGMGLVIDANGDIVVAGFVSYKNNGKDDSDIVLWRYGSDGLLKKFVTYGSASGLQEEAHAISIDKDNRIIIAGFVTGTDGKKSLAVFRYLPDMTLDPSFGDKGVLVIAGAYDDAIGEAMIIDSSGRYVVVGEDTNKNGYKDIAVWRIK